MGNRAREMGEEPWVLAPESHPGGGGWPYVYAHGHLTVPRRVKEEEEEEEEKENGAPSGATQAHLIHKTAKSHSQTHTYVYIYIYIYVTSTEKMRTGTRRVRKYGISVPSPEGPSRLGLGHFSALIPPKTDHFGPRPTT